jgi:hypothetical protein
VAVAGEAHVNDIALSGHPESFQLQSNGSMIFVNVPDAGDIEVVDRDAGTKVQAGRSPARGPISSLRPTTG